MKTIPDFLREKKDLDKTIIMREIMKLFGEKPEAKKGKICFYSDKTLKKYYNMINNIKEKGGDMLDESNF